MGIPIYLKSHGAGAGWIAFGVLSLPVLVFAIGVMVSDGITPGRIAVAAAELALVGLASFLLGYGLSRGSVILTVLALMLVILILVAYAAAVSFLIGGFNIRVF